MSTNKDILKEIGNLLKNQPKYFIWVPIVTIAIGAGVALVHHYFTFTEKYVINELCIVCYASKRSKVIEPCGHLVLCARCSRILDHCPLCR